MTDTSKRPREFWIDSLPIFNSDDIVSWKRAYTNEQDGFEKHKGNELYHVIEYSAYQSLQAEIEYLNRMLADERSGDCDKDKTIRRLERSVNNLTHAYQSLLEQCLKLEKTLENHHKSWSSNDVCYAECDSLCKALEEYRKSKEEL